MSICQETQMSEAAQFHIGCISSLLVDIVLLKLAALNLIDIDAPIGLYLPELAGAECSTQVHVRHLLSHTSGFQPPGREWLQAYGGRNWNAFVNFFRKTGPLFEPGSVFNYHGFDNVILRRILESLTGRKFEELASETLLRPFGIEFVAAPAAPSSRAGLAENHVWDPDIREYRQQQATERSITPASRDESAIAMATSAMAKLGQLLMDWTVGRGSPVDEWPYPAANLLTTPVIAVPCTKQTIWEQRIPTAFGLGCAQYEDGSFGFVGSSTGQCSAIHFDPQLSLVVSVGINARAVRVRDGIVASIFRSVRKAAHMVVESGADARSAVPDADVSGLYVCAKDDATINVVDADSRVLLRFIRRGAEDHESAPIVIHRSSQDRPGQRLTSAPRIPVCFFREPQTNESCLMYGWRAYRRLSSADRSSFATQPI
jgi:CubicO group peptidase (beta-lactamase class C family)